ncbi:MAG: hypothetical protein KatS3mg118_1259 [Paracoccaceae bacterium]|nr:MAG: hypothetical protein KatS3mg118_1259 [Paracoccaceae bacterium]
MAASARWRWSNPDPGSPRRAPAALLPRLLGIALLTGTASRRSRATPGRGGAPARAGRVAQPRLRRRGLHRRFRPEAASCAAAISPSTRRPAGPRSTVRPLLGPRLLRRRQLLRPVETAGWCCGRGGGGARAIAGRSGRRPSAGRPVPPPPPRGERDRLGYAPAPRTAASATAPSSYRPRPRGARAPPGAAGRQDPREPVREGVSGAPHSPPADRNSRGHDRRGRDPCRAAAGPAVDGGGRVRRCHRLRRRCAVVDRARAVETRPSHSRTRAPRDPTFPAMTGSRTVRLTAKRPGRSAARNAARFGPCRSGAGAGQSSPHARRQGRNDPPRHRPGHHQHPRRPARTWPAGSELLHSRRASASTIRPPPGLGRA